MILHSRITPKCPQITPEVSKSVHLGHIFLLGLAKPVFLHCPVLNVSTRVENKTIGDGGITVYFWIIKVHTSN